MSEMLIVLASVSLLVAMALSIPPETCESGADCLDDQVCQGCQCTDPKISPCESFDITTCPDDVDICTGLGSQAIEGVCECIYPPVSDPTCHPELPNCGDEIVDMNEVCDHGSLNGSSGDECGFNCQSIIAKSTDGSVVALCGNGVQEGSEECDDGNLNDFDSCANDCMSLILEGSGCMSQLGASPVTTGHLLQWLGAAAFPGGIFITMQWIKRRRK